MKSPARRDFLKGSNVDFASDLGLDEREFTSELQAYVRLPVFGRIYAGWWWLDREGDEVLSRTITFLSINPRPMVMVGPILASRSIKRAGAPRQIRHSSPRLRPWNVLTNRSSAVQRRAVSPCSCE